LISRQPVIVTAGEFVADNALGGAGFASDAAAVVASVVADADASGVATGRAGAGVGAGAMRSAALCTVGLFAGSDTVRGLMVERAGGGATGATGASVAGDGDSGSAATFRSS